MIGSITVKDTIRKLSDQVIGREPALKKIYFLLNPITFTTLILF